MILFKFCFEGRTTKTENRPVGWDRFDTGGSKAGDLAKGIVKCIMDPRSKNQEIHATRLSIGSGEYDPNPYAAAQGSLLT